MPSGASCRPSFALGDGSGCPPCPVFLDPGLSWSFVLLKQGLQRLLSDIIGDETDLLQAETVVRIHSPPRPRPPDAPLGLCCANTQTVECTLHLHIHRRPPCAAILREGGLGHPPVSPGAVQCGSQVEVCERASNASAERRAIQLDWDRRHCDHHWHQGVT